MDDTWPKEEIAPGVFADVDPATLGPSEIERRASNLMACALWAELHEKAGEGVLPEKLPKAAADLLRGLMLDKFRAELAQAPAPVRVLMDELAESRKYALALEEELRARTERLDQLLLLANSMDADFQSYAEAHPASLRITGPNSDGEYWLHIKAGGRDGGINLGVDHGPICKRLLDAATETGAKK